VSPVLVLVLVLVLRVSRSAQRGHKKMDRTSFASILIPPWFEVVVHSHPWRPYPGSGIPVQE
jgi:hypothetical protein